MFPLRTLPIFRLVKSTRVTAHIYRRASTNFMFDGVSRVGEVELNTTQLDILTACLRGSNVFFTGSAGTGKSFLLHAIIQALKGQGKNVAVTASTGIAAEHIGGTTLHSFGGFGAPVLKSDFEKMRDKRTEHRWKALDTLIIDEISMVSGELFDCVEHQVAQIRYGKGSYAPFGGVQLIVCGDFFQIPPVENEQNSRTLKRIEALAPEKGDLFRNQGYCFNARTWSQCFPKSTVFELRQVFRQATDTQFISFLNEIRVGMLRKESINVLRECRRELPTLDGIEPTQLYSRNKGVKFINETRLQELKGETTVFRAVDRVNVQGWNEITFSGREILWEDEPLTRDNILEYAWKEVEIMRAERKTMETAKESILKDDLFWVQCQAVPDIHLKLGAQVMLLKNLDLGSSSMLVNGSRGVIIGFENDHRKVLLKLVEELQKLKIDRKIQARYASLQLRSQIECILEQPEPKFPIVRFVNGREETILPDYFSSDISGIGKCIRYQLPLKLAWALTIHKCQGLTLDKASISLSGIFACGQGYVALSRVRALDSMQLKALPRKSLMVDPDVCRFYRHTFPDNILYEPFDSLYGEAKKEGWVD